MFGGGSKRYSQYISDICVYVYDVYGEREILGIGV
jgi:hypothetical protein